MPFLVVTAETLSKMPIKLLKWPPTDSGMFPADAKRTLEFTWVPKAPSLQECKEMIKKAYGIMSSQSIKIYYHDAFEVMPIVREEDFTFCRKKLENNYASYTNHVDMNRLYIVANSPTNSNDPQGRQPTLSPTEVTKRNNGASKVDRDFSERVKKAFPTVEIIIGNKFKCSCGHIGALNGQRRMGNIKRHLNTTCRLSGKRAGHTLANYFHKIATEEVEKQN